MKILKTTLLFSLMWVLTTAVAQTNCIQGSISLFNEDQSSTLCLNDGQDDIIRFRSKPFAMPYGYLVVNDDDIIVHIGTSDFINFENLPEGNLRVFSFSFIGSVLDQVGENYLEAELATGCYRLTLNHIAFTNLVPDAGLVSTADGQDQITLCISDQANTEVQINTDSDFPNYAYVITDDNGVILGSSEDGLIDFSQAAAGVCRVYGLAHIGNTNIVAGENIADAMLAAACFELTDNYVEVTRLTPDAGTLTYADGSDSYVSCSTLEPDGSVLLNSTHSTATAFTFVMVDQATQNIVSFFDNPNIELAAVASGTYDIYGVAYTAELALNVGDVFDAEGLSTECENVAGPLSFVKRVQNADDIHLADGSSEVTVCVGDGIADELEFTSTYTGNDNFVYLITDESNFLIGSSVDPVIDFEGAETGICRVWGLAYSGNLTVSVGENIGEPTLLSDECFDLSDGFVLINRNGPTAGTISYADGTTSFVSCTETSPTGTLELSVQDNDPNANYSFVVVNSADNRIVMITSAAVDIESIPNGTYEIVGVSYLGDFSLNVGDPFELVAGELCFDMTAERLDLVRRVQSVNEITLADGSTDIDICVADGFPDELTFVADYTGDDELIYVVTDETNVVLEISTNNVINFENANPGICYVWGLAYSGNLMLTQGDQITEDLAISDECFDLSNDFVQVNRYHPDAGFINLSEGGQEYVECNASESGVTLAFVTQNAEPNLAYNFLVIDEDNVIVAIQEEASLELSSLGYGTYTVYGISYLGNLAVSVGDQFSFSSLSDICFDLSDNTISITNRNVNVDVVSTVDGAEMTTICPDENADIIEFTSDYAGEDNIVYVITDTANVIVEVMGSATNDFDDGGIDLVRVWAVAFSGNFLLSPGAVLDATTVVSDDCYDISDNFVLVDRRGPQGGSVSLDDGLIAIDVCVGDGVEDVVVVATTGLGEDYAYIITDEQNVVLAVNDDSAIDFEGAESGICRVWSVAYVGELSVAAGDTLMITDLGAACAELSDNFIEVNRIAVDGGTVSLEDGSTLTFACGGDGEADFFIFDHTTTEANANYAYIITDDAENILSILQGNSVDLELAPPGECHVWGLSYTGAITALVGNNVNEVALTDACFDLSDNFITIQRDEVSGGMLSLEDGTTVRNVCPDDMADVLGFSNTGSTTGSYTYLLTDADNNFLSAVSVSELDFNNIVAPSEIRIWGLAYTGLLNTITGDVTTIELSNRCYDLSDNYITIIREEPNAGNVATTDGNTTLYLCTDDGIADVVNFQAIDASNTAYAYMVTEEDGTILALLTNTNSFDFEGATDGICRVYGAAFTGTFLAEVGENVNDLQLSNDCYDLSDNFVTIVRGELFAGTIATTLGQTNLFTCPADEQADLVELTNENASVGNYVYVLTDENDTVVDVVGSSIDFNEQATGVYHVWGLIYTGDLLITEGESLTSAVLSSACFDLSDNYITVTNIEPVAGTITANGGQTTLDLCVGDGVEDLVNFEVTGASSAAYAYLVVAADSFLVGALTDPAIDMESSSAEDWLIYGMSYTGALNVLPGANIYTDELSTACYQLTEEPLTINKTHVSGGEVFTTDGLQTVYSCPNGESDVIHFINSSTATDASYTYILTNQSDIVLSMLDSDSLDLLQAAGLTQLRIWGVSYTGDLMLSIGNQIKTAILSDGCSSLSASSIDIFIGEPVGAEVALQDGETSTQLCHSNWMPGVYMTNSSDAIVGYAYLLTNTDNELIEVSTDPNGFVNFDAVDAGIYHVWGVSYTGVLSLEVGMDVTTATLATSCFELSSNFATIERTESLDAGNISSGNGDGIIYTCPANDTPDFVLLMNDSEEENYTYFITDVDGNIVIPNIGSDLVNFDVAPAGTYLIYGMAYTGELTLNFMDNINEDALSTDCWALTNNALTVVNEEPGATTVSTLAGETEVMVEVGDGSADEIEFTYAGTSNGQYAYVITDEENVIIGISASSVIDFEDAAPGICRVWGVSYTGNLVAMQGEDMDEVMLGDDCYQLSDNFVQVVRVANEEQEAQTGEEDDWLAGLLIPQVEVTLSPNPVANVLTISIDAAQQEDIQQHLIEIYNMNGMLVNSFELDASVDVQNMSLNVSNYEDGMYLVRWYDGEQVIITRFVKQ